MKQVHQNHPEKIQIKEERTRRNGWSKFFTRFNRRIEEIEEVPDTPASDENKYIFKPRVRNLVLNRFISFNFDYKNTAVEELGLNLVVEEVGLNLVENDETLDMYTEDINFSETSTESDEISDDNDNVFKDYSASNFEMLQKPNNILNNN
ncbi:hypothetical protein F8M41_010178 [Gigaspora margarita]|uniref:Uncharacterized protein n=1 Tax=Gigaspora margarita TaxID=4874 RepID=A0A8H4EQH6_GIGMA|nr:hypothetical protein F8M41_010178 [Gigaspora margarita]